MGDNEIKLVIFDLDGVLVDTRDLHYEALNAALAEEGEQYVISREEHLTTYNGLPTRQKLDLLTERKGLPKKVHDAVWKKKQAATVLLLQERTERNEGLVSLMDLLTKRDVQVCVASNSIRTTCYAVLSKLGIVHFLSYVASNDVVRRPKPNPAMYLNCMAECGVAPANTLIFEDSAVGYTAAHASGAHVALVDGPSELTWYRVRYEMARAHVSPSRRLSPGCVNVLIPMAGAGSRFEEAGYTRPKPLIDVNGKPMIQRVVENLGIDTKFIFVVQKKHYEQYQLDLFLPLIAPNCEIVQVDGVTEGAACTTLLAKSLIDNDSRLIMANSDQFIEWDEGSLVRVLTGHEDASMFVFEAEGTKWSYAKVDEAGYVTEVAEKRVISNLGTVGVYCWRRGSDYVKYAEQMISKDIRVNGEFYVCPVFQQAIEGGLKVRTYPVHKMWGLGTPSDLEHYLKNHGA